LKQKQFLIKEIKIMENHLQNILFNIKLNESLFDKEDNKFQIRSASSYYQILNIILNKFVSNSNQLKFVQDEYNYNFSNLQLVIDE
jgi:hypothetical protein